MSANQNIPADQARHTAEPWQVFAGTIIHDAKGKTILCACEAFERRGGTFEGIRAAIARSVACVNACAGMSDPAKEIATLRAQVEELRATLAELVNANLEGVKYHPEVKGGISERVRAALALCAEGTKGGAK